MRIYPRGKRGILWADFTVDGTRIKRSTGTTDRSEAAEYASTLESSLWRTSRLGEAPRVTWDTAVLAWLGENGHLRSIEDIKLRLRWLTERLQGKDLASIDDTLIRDLVAERKKQPINAKAIKRAGAAPKASSNGTVNRHMAELSKILHYANGRKWLPVLPPILKMHEPAKRVAWLTPDQAGELLLELPPHLRAMAGLSLATGLRESNVRLLCWQQVDLARRTAWIYRDQAKADKDLMVPLNEQAMQVLLHQQGQHKRWVFPVPRWVPKKKPEDVAVQVADSPTGKISNHAWRKACTRAGVPWLKFHDLRHTWASWHAQAGTPLPVLKELGGWATLAMVEKYAHLGVSHVAAWAGNIGRGTDPVQVPGAVEPQNAGLPGVEVGWLMGFEPTTTGITRRSRVLPPSKINDLRARKGPKAA